MKTAGRNVLLAPWFVCFLAMSCGRADIGTDVFIVNETPVQVSIHELGVGPGGRDLVTVLQPGQERPTLWQFTPASRVTLKAEDSNGQLVFCRQYSYDDVRRAESRISISEGPIECR